MEETKIIKLRRELKLKEFQFSSIFEFSQAIYTSFQLENIIRVYFSTLMGQLGISRMFLYDSEHQLFHRRGFTATEEEEKNLQELLIKIDGPWVFMNLDAFPEGYEKEKQWLLDKKIQHLVNISEAVHRTLIIGLGSRLNNKDFTNENIEYAFFVSKFSASAVENAILIDRLIESKRIEHEMKIARDIQLSLLPQTLPTMENFDIFIRYEPIQDVGGDYYDIFKHRHGELPVMIADVEGKGLSAALLAASSQAIFRSLNDLYHFEPRKFMSKANEMIYELTRGKRFITLFWMLLDDKLRKITYVNAGHVEPILISGDSVKRLDKGGMITGFVETVTYEMESLQLHPGDIIAAFTDGVTEVANKEDEEFGIENLVECLRKYRHLSAKEIADNLFKSVNIFSQQEKFRDDFTLIILKVN